MIEGGDYYQPKRFVRHKYYNRPILANNIGLVVVDRPIEFNDYVQPIGFSDEPLPDDALLKLSKFFFLRKNRVDIRKYYF